MIVQHEALKGALRNLIRLIEHTIVVDETMAEAAALVARDFSDVDQPKIAAYLREIGRQHRIKALHMAGQQAALRSEYAFLL